MESKFESRTDPQLKLIHVKILGKVTVEEIIKYRSEKINAPDYIDTYDILLDISKGEIVDFLKNMSNYIDFLKNISRQINMKRKYAILTSKPLDVVDAELFIREMEKLQFGTQIEIFSEERNALFWLSY